jgi:hypothetical protein
MAQVTVQCHELKEEAGAQFVFILFDVISWQYASYQQSWNAPEYVALQEQNEFSNLHLVDT